MMKRVLIIASIILFTLPSFIFADLAHVGKDHKNTDPISQTIYAFVGSVFSLEISEPVYGGEGINLDVKDSSNELRFLIAPTNEPLSLAGASIGSFSLITSDVNKILKITHTPLILDTDINVTIDWEMGIGWFENGVHRYEVCLSKNDYMGDANRKITISLNGSGGDVVRISDAHIYFRLTPSSAVTEAGQYHASVIFEVENK